MMKCLIHISSPYMGVFDFLNCAKAPPLPLAVHQAFL